MSHVFTVRAVTRRRYTQVFVFNRAINGNSVYFEISVMIFTKFYYFRLIKFSHTIMFFSTISNLFHSFQSPADVGQYKIINSNVFVVYSFLYAILGVNSFFQPQTVFKMLKRGARIIWCEHKSLRCQRQDWYTSVTLYDPVWVAPYLHHTQTVFFFFK